MSAAALLTVLPNTMTKNITNDQINAAYHVARQVFAGGIRAGEGAALLANKHGLNLNSAKALIRCYDHLRKGERYTRTLSTPAADVFLERIFADDGPDALAQGIASVWAHLEYYESKARTTTHALRKVVERHRQLLSQRQLHPDSLSAVDEQFARELAAALSLTPEARRKRLAAAPKMPATATVSTRVFLRNADVVADVLHRANGVCEICRKQAPFMRRNGTPYLEVHHRVQLALGGEDTVENAVAACPNCHREAHFGAPQPTP